MSWESIERISWIAGIVSALIALVAAVLGIRSGKDTVRDVARIVAIATDKPDLVAALEAELLQRNAALRRRLRAVAVSAGTAIVWIALAGGAALFLASQPDYLDAKPVGGDRPRTYQECANAGEATVCQDVHSYELAAGAKVETRFAAHDRRGPRQALGRLSVTLPGCAAEVRWRVSVGGAVVAEAVSAGRAEFPVASDQEYVLTAERTGGGCAGVQVDVRTGMSVD